MLLWEVICPHLRFYNRDYRTADKSIAQINHCQPRFNDLVAPLWLIPLKYRLVISHPAEGEIYHVARHVQTINEDDHSQRKKGENDN